MPKKLESLLTMNEIAQIVVDVIEEWKRVNCNPFKIKKEICEKLDSASERIITQAAGLKKKFDGVYEIVEDSAMDTAIKKLAQEAVGTWVSEQLKSEIAISDEERAEIRSEYMKEYKNSLKERVKVMASLKATEDASSLQKLLGADPDIILQTAKQLIDDTNKGIDAQPKIEFRVFDNSRTLETAEFMCAVHLENGSINSINMDDPSSKDVWFLVRVKSAILDMSAYIVTDCKTYLPCKVSLQVRDDGVWVDDDKARILDEFTPPHQIFSLMNEADMRMIREAVNASV